MSRCVNNRHTVPPFASSARTCSRCEDERETRIMVAAFAPVLLVFVVVCAVVLYEAIGSWVIVVAAAAFLLVHHRKAVSDGLERVGSRILRLIGAES